MQKNGTTFSRESHKSFPSLKIDCSVPLKKCQKVPKSAIFFVARHTLAHDGGCPAAVSHFTGIDVAHSQSLGALPSTEKLPEVVADAERPRSDAVSLYFEPIAPA